MTVFTRKAADMSDLQALLEIEESAMPNWKYLYECRQLFLGQDNKGEMVLIKADGVPAGMGQYSVMPDGAGWLEILRVRKEWQRHGIGREIYRRYMELADETGAEKVAMYTGPDNIASRSLAELNGFHLAETFREYSLALAGLETRMPAGFREVTDSDEAVRLIDTHHSLWGTFMGLNRTWMHFGRPLYDYLIHRHMIYTDGHSSLVLGCRMLEQRGWHIGWMDGDPDTCLAFAAAKTAAAGLPKLTVTFPAASQELTDLFTVHGYQNTATLIVEEWVRGRR